MNQSLFCLFPEDLVLAKEISNKLGIELSTAELHKFPDQETLIRIKESIKGREITLICSLVNPDPKIIPLIFFAKTARDLGARKVNLVAPYLAYMRQDTQFHPDEGISSRYFAELISSSFDALITVDPHLHRCKSLSELYAIPAINLSAAPAMTDWLVKHVAKPFIIGPDKESEQWVAEIANQLKAPYTILQKTRIGDQKVSVGLPEIQIGNSASLVLLDDIISSGKTMIESVRVCRAISRARIICMGVHAVFAGSAYQELLEMDVDIVTTNTIRHPSNQIDLTSIIAANLLREIF